MQTTAPRAHPTPEPRPTRPALLSMRGVDKVFGTDVVALRGMSLEIREGDFISLLGPSGCGKSTALRLIAGLMPPTAGRIAWQGARERGDLGVVFQEPTLMPWATVAQNVFLPFRLRGKAFASVEPDADASAPEERWAQQSAERRNFLVAEKQEHRYRR